MSCGRKPQTGEVWETEDGRRWRLRECHPDWGYWSATHALSHDLALIRINDECTRIEPDESDPIEPQAGDVWRVPGYGNVTLSTKLKYDDDSYWSATSPRLGNHNILITLSERCQLVSRTKPEQTKPLALAGPPDLEACYRAIVGESKKCPSSCTPVAPCDRADCSTRAYLTRENTVFSSTSADDCELSFRRSFERKTPPAFDGWSALRSVTGGWNKRAVK